MKRNAAILALVGSLAVGLMIVRRTITGDSNPSDLSAQRATSLHSRIAEEDVPLEKADAPPETTDNAPALVPQVITAKVERRTAVDEADRLATQRNEPMRLVSGVVRDGAGHPVPDAVVLVTEMPAPGPPEPRVAILASGPSDERGCFEVRTTVRSSGLQARASKTGYVDSPLVAFRPGASNLLLVLDRGGVVSGRLLLDRWMKPEEVVVDLTIPPGSGPSLGRLQLSSFDEEGHFGMTGIDASTVELTAGVVGESEPAITIPGVAVRHVDEEPDARLDPLDLRGRFEIFTVDVLDDQGNAMTGASVRMSDAGSGANTRMQSTVLGGHAAFLTRAVPHDVEVESEGFRRARLDSVNGGQIVRLRKGLSVRVHVRGPDARPAPPALLAVGFLVEHREFMFGRDMGVSIVDGLGTLGDPHETSFTVASPGIHQVAWYLKSDGAPHFLTGSSVTVDVRDQDALQEFVLDLPEQAEKAWTDPANTTGPWPLDHVTGKVLYR